MLTFDCTCSRHMGQNISSKGKTKSTYIFVAFDGGQKTPKNTSNRGKESPWRGLNLRPLKLERAFLQCHSKNTNAIRNIY